MSGAVPAVPDTFADTVAVILHFVRHHFKATVALVELADLRLCAKVAGLHPSKTTKTRQAWFSNGG